MGLLSLLPLCNSSPNVLFLVKSEHRITLDVIFDITVHTELWAPHRVLVKDVCCYSTQLRAWWWENIASSKTQPGVWKVGGGGRLHSLRLVSTQMFGAQAFRGEWWASRHSPRSSGGLGKCCFLLLCTEFHRDSPFEPISTTFCFAFLNFSSSLWTILLSHYSECQSSLKFLLKPRLPWHVPGFQHCGSGGRLRIRLPPKCPEDTDSRTILW